MNSRSKEASPAGAPPRRVVTGLDVSGRSCILFDDAAKNVIWDVTEIPADNQGTANQGGGAFRFPNSGVQFAFNDIPPGGGAPMHATDTIDFIVVISGSITLVTETGETLLRAGDVLVDRGIVHAWRNDGTEACRLLSVMCPARPLGVSTVSDVLDL